MVMLSSEVSGRTRIRPFRSRAGRDEWLATGQSVIRGTACRGTPIEILFIRRLTFGALLISLTRPPSTGFPKKCRYACGGSKIQIGIVGGGQKARHLIGQKGAETGAGLDLGIPVLDGGRPVPVHIRNIVEA